MHHYIYVITKYTLYIASCIVECTISLGSIIPKTKKFGCVGRGDLTFLFKSCEIDRSQGRLL